MKLRTHENIYGEKVFCIYRDTARRTDFFGLQNTFSGQTQIYIGFEQYKYFINNDGKNSAETSLVTKLYSEPLTEDEIKSIVKDTVAKLFEDIKASIKS